MPSTHTYIVLLEGQVVGRRRSSRCFTHAVVVRRSKATALADATSLARRAADQDHDLYLTRYHGMSVHEARRFISETFTGARHKAGSDELEKLDAILNAGAAHRRQFPSTAAFLKAQEVQRLAQVQRDADAGMYSRRVIYAMASGLTLAQRQAAKARLSGQFAEIKVVEVSGSKVDE